MQQHLASPKLTSFMNWKVAMEQWVVKTGFRKGFGNFLRGWKKSKEDTESIPINVFPQFSKLILF